MSGRVLERLTIRDLRVIAAADLQVKSGLNLIEGPNASGKTTVLEAIHLACTGKPLRGANAAEAVRRGAARASIQLTTSTASLEVAFSSAARRLVIDGRGANRAEAARACPFLLIMPGAQREFFSEAEARRRALRWGVFHVEPAYASAWSTYSRALAQRNAALRAGDPDSAWALDPVLAREGEVIAAHDGEFCRAWAARLAAAGVSWELRYWSNWEGSLAAALRGDRARDAQRGSTTTGPHRSDVMLAAGGEQPAQVSSHGQLKMLYLTLRLCQLDVLSAEGGTRPLVLVDDIRAELDEAHYARLLAAIRARGLQAIVTAIEADAGLFDGAFHVEQGEFTATS